MTETFTPDKRTLSVIADLLKRRGEEHTVRSRLYAADSPENTHPMNIRHIDYHAAKSTACMEILIDVWEMMAECR